MTRISRSTAVHEAGHAVAAVRAGLVFDRVTAIADVEQDLDGALHWSDLEASGEVAMSPALVAVVLLAGPCAEARAMRRGADRVFTGWAAIDDRESVAQLGLTDAQFVDATREALALIEQDWPAIERVAAELLRGRELGFEDVDALVAGSAATPGPDS